MENIGVELSKMQVEYILSMSNSDQMMHSEKFENGNLKLFRIFFFYISIHFKMYLFIFQFNYQ